MSPIADPPGNLAAFPAYEIPPTTELYRIHKSTNAPWWFSSSGQGRFDLTSPHGTCYLAAEDMGAFIEVFQEDFNVIPRPEIDARRLSKLLLPQRMKLADCTHSRARQFGITAEIHSTIDRADTQVWATAFHEQGFDGIRYFVRNDPSQSHVGIALFGNAGQPTWSYPTPEPISNDLIDRVTAAFGVEVFDI